MFSAKTIQIVETLEDTTQNWPKILHLAKSVFRRQGVNPGFVRQNGFKLSCMKSCIFPKSVPNLPKTGVPGLIRTKAIFRALAPRKRLDAAKNPGTN